jgi:hypothetical protein
VPTLLAVSLPRVGPRQRNIFFLKKIFVGGFLQALGKETFYFFKKRPMPRASSLALGKEMFSIFFKKSLPGAISSYHGIYNFKSNRTTTQHIYNTKSDHITCFERVMISDA